MRTLHALGLVALTLAGCRVAAPEPATAGHLELCCKSASDDNLSFSGCRTSSMCRARESIWVRGPVSCGASSEPDCADGRCCTLDVETVAALGLDADALVGPTVADPSTPAPVPEPIVPVPLDWQARPTPVAIPKFLCPTTTAQGLGGDVILHVEVDAGGRVTEVAIRSGFDPECDALARDALLHAEFEPALSPAGAPIPASLTWVYRFEARGHDGD